jgi:hypothetical protein
MQAVDYLQQIFCASQSEAGRACETPERRVPEFGIPAKPRVKSDRNQTRIEARRSAIRIG